MQYLCKSIWQVLLALKSQAWPKELMFLTSWTREAEVAEHFWLIVIIPYCLRKVKYYFLLCIILLLACTEKWLKYTNYSIILIERRKIWRNWTSLGIWQCEFWNSVGWQQQAKVDMIKTLIGKNSQLIESDLGQNIYIKLTLQSIVCSAKEDKGSNITAVHGHHSCGWNISNKCDHGLISWNTNFNLCQSLL